MNAKNKRYLQTLASFAVAFLIFTGIQQLTFSQQPTQPVIEAPKAAHKPAPAKKKSFDQKVDEFIVAAGRVLSNALGGDALHPLTVTLILVPFFALTTYLLGLLLRILMIRPILNWWSKKATSKRDKDGIESIRRFITPLFIVLGLRISIVPIEAYFNSELSFLRNPLNAVLILLGMLMFQRALIAAMGVWGDRMADKTESNLDDQLLPILLGFSKSVIFVLGLFFAVSALGVNMTPIVASLGALSFALGFAVKDSLSNFVGGIFLVMENAFNVGDKIDIDGIGVGIIHEIGLRTTKMRTFDNEVIVIPNNALMNREYKNFRLPDVKIRVVVPFSVAYGTDVDKVRETILGVLNAIEGRLEDPAPAVHFIEMGDFSLNFQAKFFVGDYGMQAGKKLETTDKIYKALTDGGFDIPFPTYTVQMDKQ